jgi:gluconokinase
MIVVLLGVTGSGKTTVGKLLAERAGAIFADADDYHPLANREKLTAGIPLTDDDREPWLEELNRLLRGWHTTGKSGVLACSALKQRYRDTLSAGMTPGTITFVVLDGSEEMIAARLAKRKHSYMNPNLLDSQIATLEMPKDAICVENDRAPEVVAEEIMTKISQQQPGAGKAAQ